MIRYFVAQAADARITVTVCGDLKRRSFLSDDHERRVDGNAREPGSEVGPALEVPHVNKGSQE